MPSERSARVVFQEKMRFIGSASGDQTIVIDYPPPLGDDTGVRGGLDLLLMALAACAGQTVMPLLARMRQPVEACTVEAVGQRRDEHPTLLTSIHVTFKLRGSGLDAGTVERAIELAETKYCPVWAMLKDSTRITRSVEVADSGEAMA